MLLVAKQHLFPAGYSPICVNYLSSLPLRPLRQNLRISTLTCMFMLIRTIGLPFEFLSNLL